MSSWKDQSRRVITIAYRIEDKNGSMPCDKYPTKEAFVNMADLIKNSMYSRFLRKDGYTMVEYIICTESSNITDDGVVRFHDWEVYNRTTVY